MACTALLYGSVIEPARNQAFETLKSSLSSLLPSPLGASLTEFISEAPLEGEKTVLDLLKCVVALGDKEYVAPNNREATLDDLLSSLCAGYSCSAMSKHSMFQNVVIGLLQDGGNEWAKKHELLLVNSAFMAMKSIPRELSRAAASAFSFLVRLCDVLYGTPKGRHSEKSGFVWDMWPIDEARTVTSSISEDAEGGESVRPNENVFRLVLNCLVSTQHIVR